MKYRTHYTRDARKAVGQRVRVGGWVHDFRDLGRLKFVLVRDITGVLQVTMKKGAVNDALLAAVKANKEDVVSFSGTIMENKIAPDGVELVPDGFELLNRVERRLPVDPTGVVPTDIDVRLDNRYLDLRRKETALIFRVKSAAVRAYREKLASLGFTEIQTSAITGAATEGGSDVFALQYFENKAYLVQSPQLYKQMAVIGGLDRVMMTVPIFRAEKHNTTTHLNEVTALDGEMGFADHNDAMDVLESAVLHMLATVKKELGTEIAPLWGEVTVPQKVPRYTYAELVEKLNANGMEMKHGWDFTREAEGKLHGILGDELYFIHEWPTEIRAFYSMPDASNPSVCHAFDLMYRGLEISSGAERIHSAAMLEEALGKRGLDPHNFGFYLDAFRMGAPPHAGWGLGLERFVMKLCGQENIRECMMFPRDRTRLMP